MRVSIGSERLFMPNRLHHPTYLYGPVVDAPRQLVQMRTVTLADGEEIRTGIFPVQAVKPTGAGDSFMAGFMASLAEGRPLREAVLRGSACASIVVAKPGCAPAMPHMPELAAFLATHPGATSV